MTTTLPSIGFSRFGLIQLRAKKTARWRVAMPCRYFRQNWRQAGELRLRRLAVCRGPASQSPFALGDTVRHASRDSQGKWSARRASAFIVACSVLLWSLLAAAVVWAAREVFHKAR
jgi:hypothetical protein